MHAEPCCHIPDCQHSNLRKYIDKFVISFLMPTRGGNIHTMSSEPKESNRQIGQAFRKWITSGALGISPVPMAEFVASKENAILLSGDYDAKEFAQNYLGYKGDKGLDLIARFNGKYVIGEAKFLTDFGGHQNSQFNDAEALLGEASFENVIKIAILDGVCYLASKNKMYRQLEYKFCEKNILSFLLLRDFLYSL